MIIVTWFLVAKVEAVRVPVMNFYLDIKDEFTRIVIQDEGTEPHVHLTNYKELYLPSFIPDSYKPVRVIDNKYECIITYENGKGDSRKMKSNL